ncbi:hypothetical protein ACW2HD_005895, partial [Klebsiella pneumoniae]
MDKLPNFIFENYSDLKIERDTEGWSPAEVYSVTTKKKRWFLKRSHTRYNILYSPLSALTQGC